MYSVAASGETPPTNPDDLRKSFYTKRKKDVIEFDFGGSGKTAYFAVQIENEGKKDPWAAGSGVNSVTRMLPAQAENIYLTAGKTAREI
jgi:hypothetical protein